MTQVSLDTSFLISFADPDREHHAVALEYFRYCSAERIPMWISTIAAGEFEVGQPISDVPLQNFRIQPYNLPHAIRAAALYRAQRQEELGEDRRPIIINDLKILAPFADSVSERFHEWLMDKAKAGAVFTPEQLAWLGRIRDHIATSLSIDTEDFEYTPFGERGGLGKSASTLR